MPLCGGTHGQSGPLPPCPFGVALGSSWAVCFGASMFHVCNCEWMEQCVSHPWASKMYSRPVSSCQKESSPFGMNFSELLNIQKRDCPGLGPSFRNSWPSPFPHLPQDTWQDHKTSAQWPPSPQQMVSSHTHFPKSRLAGEADPLPGVTQESGPISLLPSGPQALPGVWASSSPG